MFSYKQDLFKDEDDEGGEVIGTKLEALGEKELIEESNEDIKEVADKVKSDLFLEGDDEDLDLDDLDDE